MPTDIHRLPPPRLFERPLVYPQHKRISYFQQSIMVAPPEDPAQPRSRSGMGEYFYLANDSGEDLREVAIRLAPCGALWNYHVSSASGLARADVRVSAGGGDVAIQIAHFPAEAFFELTIVTAGIVAHYDRLESANGNAILVPLNSRRVGMDAD